MRAIQITEWGGPEVLRVTELSDPVPADYEVLIEVTRAGINFADTHQRMNEYVAKAELPLVPGVEVVGIRGDSGERVLAYTGSGGYAELALAREVVVFSVPDGVGDEQALALFIQGVTAYHLLTTAGHLSEGETVVVHSAAGGVGSQLVQLARILGAGRVIATASSGPKRTVALELGADVALDGSAEGLTERLIEANDGRPVDLVIDAAGGEVFERSFDALAPFGRIVVNGISSKQKNTPSTARLLRTSRTVAGFWFRHLLEQPQLIGSALDYLFERVQTGDLCVQLGGVYPLAEAARAHEDLASRRTTGKLLLDPRL